MNIVTYVYNFSDVVHLNPPIPFRSRGFVFPIVPSHPLLIPVMVRLLYTDADNPSSRTTVQSMTTFFNTTVINMIAFGETVPPYDSFKLGIQLFYRDKEGPMFQFNDIISKYLLDPNSAVAPWDRENYILVCDICTPHGPRTNLFVCTMHCDPCIFTTTFDLQEYLWTLSGV